MKIKDTTSICLCCVLPDLWTDRIECMGQGRRFGFLRSLLSGKVRQCSQESFGYQHENVLESAKENWPATLTSEMT